MRWEPGDVSSDIEDRRDDSGGGGGFSPMGFGGGGGMRLGLGGILFLGILSVVFRQNFFALLGGGGGSATVPAESRRARNPEQTAQEDKLVRFVSFLPWMKSTTRIT